MRLGPIEISFGREKSYEELVQIINRTKGNSSRTNLKNTPKAQLAEYHGWVYSCVSLISDRVSSLPYSFYNKETGEKISSKNKGYKVFTKPFIQPNLLMSFRFIKSFCQLQLDLSGMTCIYKAQNGLGQPWELWPLNMNEFHTVEVDYTDFINPRVKYIFNMDNKLITFDIDDLIVINYPHPSNPFGAMSPVQAQAYAIDTENYIEIYEHDFFKNSARIDMALVTDIPLDEPKAEFIKNRWLNKFNGRFHDIAVLDSGLKPVPLKFTNKDFEFLHLAGWTKEKVLGAYRIPSSKLGSSDSNRAGSVQSDISFNRESIQPRIGLWDEELTMGVLSFFDERIEIRHENPIPRDRELETREAKAYLGGMPCKTVNEYRKDMLNLPEVEGGNCIYVPSSWVKLEDVGKHVPGQAPNGDSDDPDRHDDDESHVDPDGSDNRDDLPTDGRGFNLIGVSEFKSLEASARPSWNSHIEQGIKNSTSDNIEKVMFILFRYLLENTTGMLFKCFGDETIKIDMKQWILPIAEKASIEYKATIFKNPKWKDEEWNKFILEQLNSNARLAKITNTLLRACINYAKSEFITHSDGEKHWVINSNECGHRGRLKTAVSKNRFELGGTKLNFPGEILNFNCDCTITSKPK